VAGRFSVLAFVAGLCLMLAGRGGGGKKSQENDLGKAAQAACTGTAITGQPKLPASFPQIEADKLTYTRQSTEGPTKRRRGLLQR
jgi:hypothetical protein